MITFITSFSDSGSRSHVGSLESTPSVDSPLSLTSYLFSGMTSLPNASTDHLSSQESLASGKGQAEDNTSGVFSATQTSDSPIPDIDSENNSCSGEERELVNEQNNHATTNETPSDTPPNAETVKEVEILASNLCADSELEEEHRTVSMHHPLEEMGEIANTDFEKQSYFPSLSDERKPDQTDHTDRQVSNTQCHISLSSMGARMSESACTFSSDPLQVISKLEKNDLDLASSDEEDIYGHRIPHSSSDASVAEMAVSQDLTRSMQEKSMLMKSEQVR